MTRCRIELFLADMPHQARSAAHHRNAARHFPRHPDLSQQRGDRAGRVDREMPAPGGIHFRGQQPQRANMAPGDAGLFREREQARRARIVGLVVRMAEAGNRPLRRAESLRDRFRGIRLILRRNYFLQIRRTAFHGADEGTAHAEQPCGHCRLHRLRAGIVDQARGDRRGREAVLHQCHQHGVEDLRLRRRRPRAKQLKVHHFRERELADQVVHQAGAANVDRVGRVVRDFRRRCFHGIFGITSCAKSVIELSTRCGASAPKLCSVATCRTPMPCRRRIFAATVSTEPNRQMPLAMMSS